MLAPICQCPQVVLKLKTMWTKGTSVHLTHLFGDGWCLRQVCLMAGRTVEEAPYHHQNTMGWLCWQIQPIAETGGERAGVPLPPLVAMVREGGKVC